ncbi:MAG: Gfo/Idh/MocA family oxidoreductase [Kiritimatiellae bacterium]|nr:Gfo/Idh/MocA family oxidoreductase [Kiritimatiellia bacterium]
MDKVRIGIVGSKFAADFHCDSYSRNEKAEVVAVGAIDNLEAISRKWNIPDTYEDYRQMLDRDDIQLISVCVPNFLHHEVVLEAARRGKHILCEKPLATNIQDGEAMIAACEKAGVKLFYAEDWCFAPALRRVISIVDEGAVGDVVYVKAKETHCGTHSPFAKNAKTCGGGCLIHLAIHPIGWILHFLSGGGKNKVVEVIGKVNGGGADNYVHKDNTGEDWAVGILKFADGQHAFVEGNYVTVGGMDDKVEIYGKEGLVKADLTMGSSLDVYSRPGYAYALEKTDNTLGWTRPAVDEFYNLGYVHELAYAVDCVLKNEPPMYGLSGAAGLACLQIVDAMYRSSREGKTIQGEW